MSSASTASTPGATQRGGEGAISRVPIEIWTRIFAIAITTEIEQNDCTYYLTSIWDNCRPVNRLFKTAIEDAVVSTHLCDRNRFPVSIRLQCVYVPPRDGWPTPCARPLPRHTTNSIAAECSVRLCFDRLEDDEETGTPRARAVLKLLPPPKATAAPCSNDDRIWTMLESSGSLIDADGPEKKKTVVVPCDCTPECDGIELMTRHELNLPRKNLELREDLSKSLCEEIDLKIDPKRREASFLWLPTFARTHRLTARYSHRLVGGKKYKHPRDRWDIRWIGSRRFPQKS